jgi:hypothetical protein
MKIAVAAVVALALATFSVPAQAENGRNGAAVLGGVAGVALGAAGAAMIMNQQKQRPAPVVVDEEPVSVVHEQRPPTPVCRERVMDLFDRDGNFVKKDRVRVCR